MISVFRNDAVVLNNMQVGKNHLVLVEGVRMFFNQNLFNLISIYYFRKVDDRL